MKTVRNTRRVTIDLAEKNRARDSAVAIARLTLEHSETLHPRHVTELLTLACWKFTEALEKYDVQFGTRAALQPGAKRQHEHVIPRRIMIAAMRKQPDRADEILRLAVPCLVTKKEHRLLSDAYFGWERYSIANLDVIDAVTGELANLPLLTRDLNNAWMSITELRRGLAI